MQFCNRILIVDDTKEIHEDFHKILNTSKFTVNEDLKQIERQLFEDEEFHSPGFDAGKIVYRLDSAFQGQQAIDMADQAAAENDPYALIFMDVRMPPGLNGVETMERIWENHPMIEMVIVTAYSDYSWEQILDRVGTTDRLMFLRKPFDQVSVKQMALALTKKYTLNIKVRGKIDRIQKEIHQRNEQLERMLSELKILE
ncbi:Response regulator [Sulfidibacter corallicola]|uniref:Response regulator n=1 Tax=Sulfidibacter corallicola TaxID=2818388 RepID=A0A8A4TV98_SULCO|nr:response regulator [Sulfidibacter corallicola]QTD53088.1 response regulator [Sulfidibacter corallicola]